MTRIEPSTGFDFLHLAYPLAFLRVERGDLSYR